MRHAVSHTAPPLRLSARKARGRIPRASPLSSPSSNPPPSASRRRPSVFRLRVREAFVTRRRARLPVSPPRWSDGASRPTDCVVVDAEVTLVVPCYNEARASARAFLTFARGSARRLRLLFVDDGECGSTLAILSDIRSKCPEGVSVLALPRNVGKAEAVQWDARRVRRRIVLRRRLLGRRPRHPAGPRRDVPRRVRPTAPRWTWCSARASDSSVDAYDDPCDGGAPTVGVFATL